MAFGALIRSAAVTLRGLANRADGVGGQTGTLEHGAEGIAGDGAFGKLEGGARCAEGPGRSRANEVDGEVEPRADPFFAIRRMVSRQALRWV